MNNFFNLLEIRSILYSPNPLFEHYDKSPSPFFKSECEGHQIDYKQAKSGSLHTVDLEQKIPFYSNSLNRWDRVRWETYALKNLRMLIPNDNRTSNNTAFLTLHFGGFLNIMASQKTHYPFSQDRAIKRSKSLMSNSNPENAMSPRTGFIHLFSKNKSYWTELISANTYILKLAGFELYIIRDTLIDYIIHKETEATELPPSEKKALNFAYYEPFFTYAIQSAKKKTWKGIGEALSLLLVIGLLGALFNEFPLSVSSRSSTIRIASKIDESASSPQTEPIDGKTDSLIPSIISTSGVFSSDGMLRILEATSDPDKIEKADYDTLLLASDIYYHHHAEIRETDFELACRCSIQAAKIGTDPTLAIFNIAYYLYRCAITKTKSTNYYKKKAAILAVLGSTNPMDDAIFKFIKCAESGHTSSYNSLGNICAQLCLDDDLLESTGDNALLSLILFAKNYTAIVELKGLSQAAMRSLINSGSRRLHKNEILDVLSHCRLSFYRMAADGCSPTADLSGIYNYSRELEKHLCKNLESGNYSGLEQFMSIFSTEIADLRLCLKTLFSLRHPKGTHQYLLYIIHELNTDLHTKLDATLYSTFEDSNARIITDLKNLVEITNAFHDITTFTKSSLDFFWAYYHFAYYITEHPDRSSDSVLELLKKAYKIASSSFERNTALLLIMKNIVNNSSSNIEAISQTEKINEDIKKCFEAPISFHNGKITSTNYVELSKEWLDDNGFTLSMLRDYLTIRDKIELYNEAADSLNKFDAQKLPINQLH